MSEGNININVKIVGGEGCTLSVQPNISIANLKKLIENQLRLTIGAKKLLYKGKPLVDDKTLADYNISNEGILYLMRNKSDVGTSSSVVTPPKLLHGEMKRFLLRYFGDVEAERIAVEYMKDFNRTINLYNLDDWERIATKHLNTAGHA